MKVVKKAGDGADEKLISRLTGRAVEKINEQEADNWLKIGERTESYVLAMTGRFGGGRDWYVELAEHPASVHGATMLRNYAGAWATWKKLTGTTRHDLRAEGITVTHVAQVLSRRYSDEAREAHLSHAARHRLSVSEFRAYLRGLDKDEPAAAAACPAGTDVPPAAGPSAAPDGVTPTDWKEAAGSLSTALNRAYGQMVGLKHRMEGQELPEAVVSGIREIIRFAIVQRLISGDQVRELMSLTAPEIEHAASGPAPAKAG